MSVPFRHHTVVTMLFENRHEAVQIGLGFLGALWMCFPQAAEVLPKSDTQVGTLFYSAAERRNINQARSGTLPGVAASASNEVQVNGIVKRQAGHSTAWVNGQAINENQPVPAAIGPTSISATGIVLNGKAVQVGETFNLTTQERSDIVRRGAVTPKGAQ